MYKKITVLVSSVLFSCHQGAENPPVEDNLERHYSAISEMTKTSPKPSSSQAAIKQVSFTANVKYMNLEGGFFGLISKENKHWLPMNLKQDFQQDGAIIKVTGHVIKNVITIQQWGTPFTITRIELIEAGRKVAGKHLH